MSDSVAARLAATIRTGMKDRALSGTEVAERVGQLTGRYYPPQYLSRRLSGARPYVRVADDFYAVCTVLGLDANAAIVAALAGNDEAADEDRT